MLLYDPARPTEKLSVTPKSAFRYKGGMDFTFSPTDNNLEIIEYPAPAEMTT